MFKQMAYYMGHKGYTFAPYRNDNDKVFLLTGQTEKIRNQAEETIEALYMNDYTGYYNTYDKDMGFDCDLFTGSADITFTEGGSLSGKLTAPVKVEGKVNDYHLVRLLPDGSIRSLGKRSNADEVARISTNMLHYNNALSGVEWQKLAVSMNRIFDSSVIEVGRNTLKFNTMDIKVKTVYLLVAECYLTPVDTQRIVLLPDINKMLGSDLILTHSLLSELSKINRLDMILGTEYYDMGTVAKKCEVVEIG